MSSSIQPQWHTEHTICSYDVDPQRATRLPALCRFMQDAAYHHAEHLGLGYSRLVNEGRAWVLARQRIEMHQRPNWGETIQIRTWPSGRDRLFFHRDFEITDGLDRIVLQASTAWFMMDLQKRERVDSSHYMNIDLPPVGMRIFDSALERLKGGNFDGGEMIRVNYGDLDMSGHVNNVRYIEWVLNQIPQEYHQKNRLQSLEVNYLAEAVYGQDIFICTNEPEAGRFEHGIVANGADLFRARSLWVPA